MNPRNEINIQINIDWRMFAILVIIAGALLAVFGAVRAQDGAPVYMNDLEEQTPVVQPVSAPPELVDCAAGLLPTMNGECIQPDAPGFAPSSVMTVTLPSQGRHYYVTNFAGTGDKALTACAAGYHMASFWEIVDVSNLTYDYNHPSAVKKTDSGFGPPSFFYGWVRTGQDSSGVNSAGSGNCLNWTVGDAGNYGVAVRLTRTWETPPGEIGPWDATSFMCNTIGPVWCVKN